ELEDIGELEERYPYDVYLYMYDITDGWACRYSPLLLGQRLRALYHTGIVVRWLDGDLEYWFGGRIQTESAGRTPYGEPLDKRFMGTTLRLSSSTFVPDSYDIAFHNCNSFSAAMLEFLCDMQLGIGQAHQIDCANSVPSLMKCATTRQLPPDVVEQPGVAWVLNTYTGYLGMVELQGRLADGTQPDRGRGCLALSVKSCMWTGSKAFEDTVLPSESEQALILCGAGFFTLCLKIWYRFKCWTHMNLLPRRSPAEASVTLKAIGACAYVKNEVAILRLPCQGKTCLLCSMCADMIDMGLDFMDAHVAFMTGSSIELPRSSEACTSLGEKATACYARSPGLLMVAFVNRGSHQDLYDESLLNAFREQAFAFACDFPVQGGCWLGIASTDSGATLTEKKPTRYCGPTTDLVSRNAFALEPEKDIEFAGRTARSEREAFQLTETWAARELQRASAAVIEMHMFLRIGRLLRLLRKDGKDDGVRCSAGRKRKGRGFEDIRDPFVGQAEEGRLSDTDIDLEPLLLSRICDRGAALQPDNLIITRTPSGYVTQTYVEHGRRATWLNAHGVVRVVFFGEAKQLGSALTKWGVNCEDRVATLMWNTGRALIGDAQMMKSGQQSVRLNPADLEYIISHAQDRVIIVDAVLCTVLKQAESESRLAGEFTQRASTQIDAAGQ
ncbi:desi1, partial [Symbiodinium microadriaticum]